MIYFLTTGAHKYALHALADIPHAPDLRILSYNRLLKQRELKAGTYIFCDMDRLDFWSLELAARAYQLIVSEGWPALNNPAVFRHRFALLQKLKSAGLNSFAVWDPDVALLPDRFPVFLRTRAAHRGVLGDLCHTRIACEAALASALKQGHTLSDLMFIEFCAEPLEGTLYRKCAAFRIGEHMVTGLSVHEHHWHAKYGEEGAASLALYEEEYEAVKTNRHGDLLRMRFDAVDIDFGRADFAFVKGSVETYEINTNPHIAPLQAHPVARRLQTDRLCHEQLGQALKELDRASPNTGRLLLDGDVFRQQRRRDRFVLTERWRP